MKSKVHRENRSHKDIHTINNASRLIIVYIKYIQFTTHTQIAFLCLPLDNYDQSTGVIDSELVVTL